MDDRTRTLEEDLAAQQRWRREQGLQRTIQVGAAAPIDLASNDYLGLSRDPRVVAGAVAALDGMGDPGSG